MWALLILIVAVPGNNIPAIDSHLTFATLADCRAAKVDVQDALNRRNMAGTPFCIRLRDDIAPDH